MNRLFRDKRFQVISLAALIILFWFPIMSDNELFYDDWSFVESFKQGAPSLRWFFEPHNEHFMPMFKLIFFGMFRMFGTDIVPYMGLTIFFHAAVCILFLLLLRRIFVRDGALPYILALFFALNAAYYEVLHWFTASSQMLVLFFLLLSLILLHEARERNDRKAYFMSLAASFFIPMNFSIGFLGVMFIGLYYFLVLKGREIREFIPYVLVWSFYLAVFVLFSLNRLLNVPDAAPSIVLSAERLLSYATLGLMGLYLRIMGFSMLVFPYTTGLAVVLTLLTAFLGAFYLFYFMLNRREERAALLSGNGPAQFALLSLLACYLVFALGRASIEAEAFLNWGRYHYMPLFFLTIFLGAVLPRTIEIFSRMFNGKRFRGLLVVMFVIFLATQFVLIRQKAASPVRTEGSLPVKVTVS